MITGLLITTVAIFGTLGAVGFIGYLMYDERNQNKWKETAVEAI